MDFVKWTIKALTLKTRHVLAITIFTGAILYMPDDRLKTFGITAFVKDNRQSISVTFLFSAAVLVSPFVLKIVNTIKIKITNLIHERVAIAYLQSLTPDEKDILRPYILKETRTQVLDTTSGTVSGLISANIVYLSSISSMTSRHMFPHNIYPWAWNFLNKNRSIVVDRKIGKEQ